MKAVVPIQPKYVGFVRNIKILIIAVIRNRLKYPHTTEGLNTARDAPLQLRKPAVASIGANMLIPATIARSK